MQKLENVKIEDSNIAMLGSDLELKVRREAAQNAEEWQGCGEKVGVEVWRIEQFKVKRWPQEQYGTFYDGDSYIVLKTYKPDPDSEKLAWNAHFWLGKDTSQDEAGTAAYKTVELDDYLGTTPVQYREVQGHESAEFLSLFPPSIKILSGGVDSGFNKVEAVHYKPRLMHIKGKMNNVRSSQVELAVSTLNDGDVFILDIGLDLFIWQGHYSNYFEKRKAQEVVDSIKFERNGKPRSEIIHSGDPKEYHPKFWEVMGVGTIQSAEAGGDDTKVEEYEDVLTRISDITGQLEMTEVARGVISSDLLDSRDVFLLDTSICLYAWIGKDASKKERAEAYNYANKYLLDNGLPFTTNVVRVVQGGCDNKSFNKHFADKKATFLKTVYKGNEVTDESVENFRDIGRMIIMDQMKTFLRPFWRDDDVKSKIDLVFQLANYFWLRFGGDHFEDDDFCYEFEQMDGVELWGQIGTEGVAFWAERNVSVVTPQSLKDALRSFDPICNGRMSFVEFMLIYFNRTRDEMLLGDADAPPELSDELNSTRDAILAKEKEIKELNDEITTLLSASGVSQLNANKIKVTALKKNSLEPKEYELVKLERAYKKVQNKIKSAGSQLDAYLRDEGMVRFHTTVHDQLLKRKGFGNLYRNPEKGQRKVEQRL